MANVSFGVLLTGDGKSAIKAINLTSKELKDLENNTGAVAKKVKASSKSAAGDFDGMAKSAAKMGAAIGAAAIALGGFVLSKVIKETGESEAVIAQLNTTLAATGGVAGKSANALIEMGAKMQAVTAFSDDAVIGVENLLLNFTAIKGDNFDRTTRAVLDLSTAMHMDLNSAAKLVGKALEEPDKGLTRLARSGVTFTAAQKETIKALVEVGDKATAQTIILEQLEARYKGSAEAARGTLKGALDALKISFNDLFEVSSTTSNGMTESLNNLNKTLSDPAFKASVEKLIQGLISVVNYSVQAAAGITDLAEAIGVKFAQAVAGIATDDLKSIRAEIEATQKVIAELESSGQGDRGSRGAWLGVGDLDAERDKLKGLEAQLAVNLSLFGKTGTAVETYTKQLATASGVQDQFSLVQTKGIDANGKFTLVVNNATKATTANSVETKRNSDLVLVSQATRDKAAAAATKQAAEEDKLTAAKNAQRKAIVAIGEENLKESRAAEALIASLKNETAALGMTAKQQAVNNALQKAGTEISEGLRLQVIAAAEANYDAAAALQATTKATEEATRQQEQMWSHLTDSMSDIFTQMVTDGSKSFDLISDGFSALIKKMLAEAAFNEIVIGFGGTAANGQNSSNSTMSGRLTNAATTYGLSELISSAFKAFTGSKEDLKNDPLAKVINKFADASFKPIEWLTGKSFGDVFGQKNDGNNQASATFDTATGKTKVNTWGNSPGDPSAITQITDTLVAFAKMIGGSTASGGVSSSRGGLSFNGKNFGQDIDGLMNAAFDAIVTSATTLKKELKPLVLAFNGTAEEIANFTASIMSISESSAFNAVEEAGKDFAKGALTAAKSYAHTVDALQDSIDAFDGTASAASNLNDALLANKAAAYDFAIALEEIGKAIADSAEASADAIRESVMTDKQLTTKRTKERDRLLKSLQNNELIDPEDIRKTTDRILELNSEIFQGMSETARKSNAEAFAGYAENVGSVAKDVLQNQLNQLREAESAVNDAIKAVLQAAADKQLEAANIQLEAANRFAAAVLTSTSSEVSR